MVYHVLLLLQRVAPVKRHLASQFYWLIRLQQNELSPLGFFLKYLRCRRPKIWSIIILTNKKSAHRKKMTLLSPITWPAHVMLSRLPGFFGTSVTLFACYANNLSLYLKKFNICRPTYLNLLCECLILWYVHLTSLLELSLHDPGLILFLGSLSP